MPELKFQSDATKEQHEALADEEIQKFNEWFQQYQAERGDRDAPPLVRSERAILKTYLFYRLRVADR